MSAERFTFTVRGPIFELGTWHADADVTDVFVGSHDEPATRAEIEELVAIWKGSPVEWDGLTGRFIATLHEIGEIEYYECTITLTEVPA